MAGNDQRIIATELALLIALGGTSYAASSSSKNSGSQLKNHSVSGKKLVDHTVTGTQVNVSGFPKVPSAHHADHATNATTAGTITGSITGSQVSSAVANATTATNLAGSAFAQINKTSGSATAVTILDLGGLELALRCTGGDVDIDAATTTNDAGYVMSGVANSNATNLVDKEGDFNVGDTVTDTTADPAQESFSYAPSSTEVVSGTMTSYDNGGICSVFGNAEESS